MAPRPSEWWEAVVVHCGGVIRRVERVGGGIGGREGP